MVVSGSAWWVTQGCRPRGCGLRVGHGWLTLEVGLHPVPSRHAGVPGFAAETWGQRRGPMSGRRRRSGPMSGRRRYAAASLAGSARFPAVIRESQGTGANRSSPLSRCSTTTLVPGRSPWGSGICQRRFAANREVAGDERSAVSPKTPSIPGSGARSSNSILAAQRDPGDAHLLHQPKAPRPPLGRPLLSSPGPGDPPSLRLPTKVPGAVYTARGRPVVQLSAGSRSTNRGGGGVDRSTWSLRCLPARDAATVSGGPLPQARLHHPAKRVRARDRTDLCSASRVPPGTADAKNLPWQRPDRRPRPWIARVTLSLSDIRVRPSWTTR